MLLSGTGTNFSLVDVDVVDVVVAVDVDVDGRVDRVTKVDAVVDVISTVITSSLPYSFILYLVDVVAVAVDRGS